MEHVMKPIDEVVLNTIRKMQEKKSKEKESTTKKQEPLRSYELLIHLEESFSRI